jgi:hypothetical protein
VITCVLKGPRMKVKRGRGRPPRAAVGPREHSQAVGAAPAEKEAVPPKRPAAKAPKDHFGQFDLQGVPRCPRCGHLIVARMTKAGPAMVCPCSHPGEYFWGKGERVTGGGCKPSDESRR